MGAMDWILAIDAGNSVTRVAAVRAREVLAKGRVPTRWTDLADRLRHMVEGFQCRLGRPPETVGISNVVPEQGPALASAAAGTGAPVVCVNPDAAAGLTIAYRPAESLGPDRIANAVAVWQAFGTACIAVDLGTALTIDVVDAAGVFRGGAIFPGMSAARGALGQTTARVDSVVEGVAPSSVIGGSTREGVSSGLGYGYPAVIDGLLHQVRSELEDGAPAVLTGGGRRLMARPPTGITRCDPHLTLRGVAAVAAAESRATG